MDYFINNLSKEDSNNILRGILFEYIVPSFGILPKSEINLVFLDALIKIGYIDKQPTIYELVSKLKITNTKARTLIYERELRLNNEESLDNLVKDVLAKPIIEKSGEVFLFEIDNPLLIDHLKYKLRMVGCLSDGSFSPSIIRLSKKAFLTLVESIINKDISEQNKESILEALSDTELGAVTFNKFLREFIRKVGYKIANNVGEDMVEKASDYIGMLFDNLPDNINKIKNLFEKE